MLICLISAALATQWQAPNPEILDVLHAPRAPWAWTSPSGATLLLADPVVYPSIDEYAAGWHELAGIRVDPGTGGPHGRHGARSARLVSIADGSETAVPLPEDAELFAVSWTADGQQYALTVRHSDHFGLWVGDLDGSVQKIDGISLNPLLGTVQWLPDQQRLLVHHRPHSPQSKPQAPTQPQGPEVLEGSGATARSTYESRNLLQTSYDDSLFAHYNTTVLTIVDPDRKKTTPLGDPAVYTAGRFSPDGRYILVERLVAPWSHQVPWWRFKRVIEVWNRTGKKVSTIASLGLADQVPTMGVATGPRSVRWRPTAPHTLYWAEALDGGDPRAEVDHRDRLMRLKAPFNGTPEEVFRTTHRLNGWSWTEGDTVMLTERERMRRWRYTWLLDVATGSASLWFDLSEKDRYKTPGSPLTRPLPNGFRVLHQQGDAIYFQGRGASPDGDRPFLDLRSMTTRSVERLFRSDADRYESVISVTPAGTLVTRSESSEDPPNYYLSTLTTEVKALPGEASRRHTSVPITHFTDPTPALREIERRIVRYEREDGVALSFQLYLPPGYTEGTRLPTVVYAYPLEYSDPSTAGQVRGSTRRFDRFAGASPLFFVLDGYAVLHQTAMPMVGDPETVYDTFVPQLVADAEAAVKKAIEIGVADPDRIGVIGHSHGGLMVANLLAHTDLFRAGIARSGSYNKTTQPFGFQSERRTLFEARDTYVAVSPTFFADQISEPILVIHGDSDSNPGTLTFQSEVFFEAVRGSGGTTRLVLLPYEDHGYRARESVEHVLWEQLRWFDRHLR